MASVRVSDLIKSYDGSGDVVQWIEKVELVAKLQKISNVAEFLPLFLTGPALAVYQQLDDSEKDNSSTIKRTLTGAFGLNPFQAYEQLTRKKWSGEAVDAYLSEIRRLASLANVESETLVKRAFIVGLPQKISRELRATAKVESLGMDAILHKARAYMAEYTEEHVVAVAGEEHVVAAVAKRHTESFRNTSRQESRPGETTRCYRCNGPHVMKDCPVNKGRRCWNCGNTGHMARDCTAESASSGN